MKQVAGRVANNMRTEMQSVFDRPTPYVLRSIQVELSTSEKIEAMITPTYMGGKGIDPQKILKAQADGGPRRDKRSEKAFRRVGILPAGMQMVIPKTPFPGSDDGRGNLRGPFVVQLISYFNAFGEQGYKANMTDRRRKQLADRASYSSLYNKHTYSSARGVQFFVVKRSGMVGVHDYMDKTRHLQPGIWAKSGLHGSTGIHRIWPVAIFTRAGNYPKRLDIDKILRETDVNNLFAKWFRGNVRDAYRAWTGGGL